MGARAPDRKTRSATRDQAVSSQRDPRAQLLHARRRGLRKMKGAYNGADGNEAPGNPGAIQISCFIFHSASFTSASYSAGEIDRFE